MGSGTTAVACIKLRRNYVGFEINPEYCKIVKERIKKIKSEPSLFAAIEINSPYNNLTGSMGGKDIQLSDRIPKTQKNILEA